MRVVSAVVSGGLLALFLFVASAASALPIVSVDGDSTTSGIQTNSVVSPGSIEVDIIVSDVDASAPLNAFSVNLTFDPSVLTAVSVVDGGFLLSPVFIVKERLGILRVEFTEVTVGGAGAIGSGALATITFDTVAPGTSALTLQNVVLYEGQGSRIATESLEHGSLTVGEAPIPEPTTLVGLATFGIAGTMLRRGRSRRAS